MAIIITDQSTIQMMRANAINRRFNDDLAKEEYFDDLKFLARIFPETQPEQVRIMYHLLNDVQKIGLNENEWNEQANSNREQPIQFLSPQTGISLHV